jgi:hypothetical protein
MQGDDPSPPSPHPGEHGTAPSTDLGFGCGREGLANLRDACDRSLERLAASSPSDRVDPALAAAIHSLRTRTIDALAEHDRRR